jgi:SH3-like domain-containing protein
MTLFQGKQIFCSFLVCLTLIGLPSIGFSSPKNNASAVSSSKAVDESSSENAGLKGEEASLVDQTDREQTSQEVQGMPSDGVPRGRSSGLPLPRFVSLNTKKAYIRRGPDNSQTIDWIYQREGLPLQIVDEFEHWRKIRDYEGTEGWIHKKLLSSKRTVMSMKDQVQAYQSPAQTATVTAKLEKGVVMKIKRCNDTWCDVEHPQFHGWVLKSGLWGVFSSEYLDN